MLRIRKLTILISLLLYVVTKTVTTFANDKCYNYLNTKDSVNNKYKNHPGQRDHAHGPQGVKLDTEVSSFNLQSYPFPLDIHNTSNRIAIRSLLSEALNPIFVQISESVPTDQIRITKWAKDYSDLIESLIFHEVLEHDKPLTSDFEVYGPLFDKIFPYKAEIYGLWTEVDPDIFQFGVAQDEFDLIRKLLASMY